MAEKQLEPLYKIFQNKLFRIPDYQRGYAWQTSQLVDFWEDIINLLPDHNHYTGMLSIKKIEDKEHKDNDDQWLINNGYDVYHVIDGQQRLTTFVILINELLTFVKNLPENKDKKDEDILIGIERLSDVKSKYICRQCPPENIITTYIFNYDNDNPSAEYLKHKIFNQDFGTSIKETYYTKNLKNAKNFFSERIDNLYKETDSNMLIKLYNKIVQHLTFNIHYIEDDYDVFVAFETMNNRGKTLTNLELLKNRLIYLTTLYNKQELSECNEYALRKDINDAWKEIYYQLGRNEKEPLSDDEFLKAHWSYYFKYSRKKGNDYIKYLLTKFSQKSIFGTSQYNYEHEDDIQHNSIDYDEENSELEIEDDEEYISDNKLKPKEIDDYVKSLSESAEAWYYTYYPYDSKTLCTEEKVWIDKLNKIGIGYFRPLVTVALLPHLQFEPDKRIKLFQAIERFIFINFRLAGYQSSYKSSECYNKTRNLYKKEINIDDYIEYLEIVSNQNISNAINLFINKMDQKFDSDEGFYSWITLKYFLYEYEYELAQKTKIEKLDWAVLTKVVKDKITVEHILPQTPTKYYWQNQFRQYSDEEISILTNSLGNLLPLSRSINSKAQNNEFDKKKELYINGSHSEIEVSKLKDWTAEEIHKRGMQLLEFMERRWKFNFESEEQKENLLHIDFVNDEREEIPPLTEEEVIELSDDKLASLRTQYWTFALPKIVTANSDHKSFSNVAPSNSTYKDGHIGISCMHLYCKISTRPTVCTAGFWIDTGFAKENEIIFQVLYRHKDEIEKHLSAKTLDWDNRGTKRSKSINAILENVDFRDQNQWEVMSDFQAKLTKELYDYGFKPYEDEIRNAL